MGSIVEGILEDLIGLEGNRLWPERMEPAWENPVVGTARGDDPVFGQFKDVVGPVHWTPREAFSLAFPDVPAKDENLGIFSWILPQTDATKKDNRRETVVPAERWARSRIFGERFNDFLRHEVAARLSAMGIPAIAPMTLPDFQAMRGGPYGRMSTWSERHTAYACGLGTFGLCDGLITPVGKAVRFGSVVAQVDVEPARRLYTDHHAYCLFYAKGTCGKCIERCPADALGPQGHDKERCFQHLDTVTKPHVTNAYGFDGYGCGLCQTDTPCESRIPKGLT